MTSIGRKREDSESGVVLIIFALAMVILLGMIAIALDGGYGFVQNRRAQNAADFAAFAAAQQLNSSTYCNGTTSPDHPADRHDRPEARRRQRVGHRDGMEGPVPELGGESRSGLSPSNTGPTNPPPGACGVNVNATPKWTPFFAGIFGIHQLNGFASGSVGNVAKGPPSASWRSTRSDPTRSSVAGPGPSWSRGPSSSTRTWPSNRGPVPYGRFAVGRRHRRQDRQQPVRLRHHRHREQHVHRRIPVAAGPVLPGAKGCSPGAVRPARPTPGATLPNVQASCAPNHARVGHRRLQRIDQHLRRRSPTRWGPRTHRRARSTPTPTSPVPG